MRRGRPQGQVAENLLDHRGLFNERDDSHGSGASGTHERIVELSKKKMRGQR
jgi:hypothetical protein